jgi:hypothetical protein
MYITLPFPFEMICPQSKGKEGIFGKLFYIPMHIFLWKVLPFNEVLFNGSRVKFLLPSGTI